MDSSETFTVERGDLARFENVAEHAGLEIAHHIREGRFQRSLALIAGLSSVLSGLEVAYEHYRGSYSQRIMYTPVILSQALLVAGICAAMNRRAGRTLLPIVSAVTLADCAVGFGFHIRGIQRKPGGWRIPIFNVIMGPPLCAPLLFGMSAYLGRRRSRNQRREHQARNLQLPTLAHYSAGT
jgi:hypothetical protein